MLPYLEAKKVEIENYIGTPLEWNPNPGNRDKVILLNESVDFDDEQEINQSLNWMVDYTIKFREIFAKIIKQHR